MKIGIVIPDKKDRPLFLNHCLRMMKNQTLKADVIRIVNDDSCIDGCDITWRYKKGLTELFEDEKCDVVLKIENDDWYADVYIESMINMWMDYGMPAIFGLDTTTYYHIGLRKYKVMKHEGRSSAFCTLVTKEVLNINWCKDTEPFFDLHLWKQPISKIAVSSPLCICIGIKHGHGLCGGKAHRKEFPYPESDHDLSFLSRIVDKESLEFYKSIANG